MRMKMIKGVKITPLKVFSDDRGSVKHMIKSTDSIFTQFGEIYFSEVLPGKVKAWGRRKTAIRHYAVIEGTIRLVLYDGNEKQELIVGEDNYCLVSIPPGVWSGFKALKNKKAIVADLTDLPYDPEDVEKKDSNELLDCWNGA